MISPDSPSARGVVSGEFGVREGFARLDAPAAPGVERVEHAAGEGEVPRRRLPAGAQAQGVSVFLHGGHDVDQRGVGPGRGDGGAQAGDAQVVPGEGAQLVVWAGRAAG